MSKDLKELVNEFSNKNDSNAIENDLKIIGRELLNNYEIRIIDNDFLVKNVVIEFLRVEPYFYKPKEFEDKFIHYERLNGEILYGPHQRKRCGQLYIHKGYTGVDIVLSRNDAYAFSFLIKNSRIWFDGKIKDPFVKQIAIAKRLEEIGMPLDYDRVVLEKKKHPSDNTVFNTVRKGLTTVVGRDDFPKEKQARYSLLPVSSFIMKDKTNTDCKYNYDFEKGFGIGWAVAYYLHQNHLEPNDDNIRRYYGSKSEEVKSLVQRMNAKA